VGELSTELEALKETSRVEPIRVRKLSGLLPLVRILGPLAMLAILLALWTLLARYNSATILPGPHAVWTSLRNAIGNGTYWPAVGATSEEAALGWVIALVVALPLGYLIGRVRSLEDVLAPYLAGSQAMPIVAIAPLLIVWVGFGLKPKVIVCSLIAFFPILATTASGVRGVPRDLRDTARVFGAGWLAMARLVDFPLAARTIFSGLKISAALAITGAVVGEFVNPDQGLGHLIVYGSNTFDTPLMFVGLISLIALGASAYTAVSLAERVVLRWDE
jgi:NitT/TauT family transport system permease protein